MTTTMHEKFDILLETEGDHECEGLGRDKICVRIVAMAELPTRFGDFHIVAFENNRDGKEHVAITKGDVIGAEDVPVRLHSECLTGDVMGSLRCDCRDQLEAALTAIGQMEKGMVLYLRQEGRGIGLINKIRAYSLQDDGLDTVEANLALGFRDDERDYAVAAHMLMSLKIQSVQLMTNNPKKINQLTQYGIKVNGRIPAHHAAERAQPFLPGDQGRQVRSHDRFSRQGTHARTVGSADCGRHEPGPDPGAL